MLSRRFFHFNQCPVYISYMTEELHTQVLYDNVKNLKVDTLQVLK